MTSTAWKYGLVRWALLLGGGLVGTALVIVHTWYFWSDFANAPEDSFKRMIIVLQTSILFIMAIYNTGYYGSRLLRLPEMAAEIRQNQRWHSKALNGCLLLIYLLAFVFE